VIFGIDAETLVRTAPVLVVIVVEYIGEMASGEGKLLVQLGVPVLRELFAHGQAAPRAKRIEDFVVATVPIRPEPNHPYRVPTPRHGDISG
jgi:hypothetical protein